MAIEIFPGAVQFDFPEDIASETLKQVYLSKSVWRDSEIGHGNVAKHIRSSESMDLDQLKISKEKVRPFMYDCVKKYTKYYNTDVYNDEGLNLLRYESYDKYEYHIDYGLNRYRTVSALIYLNPGEYSGGGTTFKHFNHTIQPKNPSLVLFPSNYPYLHAAEPVTSGVKYIVVTWMNDKPNNLIDNQSGCSCGNNHL